MLTLKHNRLRQRIIQSFTISQIVLAILTMLLMGRLWLAPIKLNLQEELPSWRDEIKYYNYKLAPGVSGPRLASTSSAGTLFPAPNSVSALDGQIRFDVTNGDHETEVMRRQRGGIWATSTGENYNERSPEQNQAQDYSGESDPISRRTTDSATYIHSTTTQQAPPEPAHGRLAMYERGLGTSAPGQLVPAHEPHNYLRPLDKLQQALGCCGVESPHDWAKYNERLGLLAPSCCKHPRAMKVSWQLIDQGSRRQINASEMATDLDQWSSRPPSETVNRQLKVRSPERNGSRNNSSETSGGEDKATRALDESLSPQEETVIYFCPLGYEDPGAYVDGLDEHQDKGGVTVDASTGQTASRRPLTQEELLELQLASEWTNAHPNHLHLNQHQQVIPIVYGCQRTLDGRDSRCLFGLRLSLLVLVALLFLNIIAQSAAFEGKRRRRRMATGTCRGPRLGMESSGMPPVQVTCQTRLPRLGLATANNAPSSLPTPQRQTSHLNGIIVPSGRRPMVVSHD